MHQSNNINNIMSGIFVTTRFNAMTWRENQRYRESHQYVCIYSTPKPIRDSIGYNRVLYVIEMNNTENRIEGIGLIRNHLQKQRHKIYEENNWNRYCYMGHYYLDRTDLVQDATDLVRSLETLLFKGKGHFKRGAGMTTLTEKNIRKLEGDIHQEIKHMFLKKYKNERVI